MQPVGKGRDDGWDGGEDEAQAGGHGPQGLGRISCGPAGWPRVGDLGPVPSVALVAGEEERERRQRPEAPHPEVEQPAVVDAVEGDVEHGSRRVSGHAGVRVLDSITTR
jgi:hypothetical protein